ncbi:TPA: hypothetical protein ACH3X2_006292 [Trebouxia sp. C0005]
MVKAEPSTQDLFVQARKLRAQKASAERGTSQALLQAQTKQWLAARDKRLPLPPLSPKVLAFIKEWYFLVDTDGSGELSLDEVAAAMRASGIPHTIQTVEELFNLVDIDGSGIMEWSEFETFVANEIQEGRDFMEGEFVLPSGAGIQFAAMVDVLRRKSRLAAVMKGGNARETTVAKMVEEVEAHALFERTSALVRATGSRRIPKLRPSPCSPSGWALATQQSVQAMPLNKLTEEVSTLDSTCSSVSSVLMNSENHHDSQIQLCKDDAGMSPVTRQMHMRRPCRPEAHTPVVLGREADLLNACASQAVDNSDSQINLDKSAAAKAENAAEVGEAIMLEEKYHRAGREVMGQRVDQEALASAAAERAKRNHKSQQQHLGYKPLRHNSVRTKDHRGLVDKLLTNVNDFRTARTSHRTSAL